ncbi:MAG: glycosyltransferase [Methylococcales bacterium]|nr:glycosyltransferase [Methylococcales bacterium]
MPNKLVSKSRIAIITNIPAPYRMDIYSHLAKHFGCDQFHVVFCAQKEANRDWVIDNNGFAHTFLKTNYITWNGRYIHYNPDALSVLKQLKPDVIITTGFNPTHLLAFPYAVFTGKVHIPMTDGTYDSELKLSVLHRIVRRVVYRFSKTFIGASLGALRLYQSYGINVDRFYQSHLCANNAAFTALNTTHKPYDLMFSGRFSPEKNPLFALDIAAGVAKNLNRPISILMLGAGPLLDEAKAYAESLALQVTATFPGFLQQAELPALYNSAKVFLFPSSWDPWGVVANEACAAGQAVIVSPHAGVANELVCHGENGYVLDLVLDEWIKHTTELLSNPDLLAQFSKGSQIKVQAYSYEAAAQGIINAVNGALI